jgi:hypothetical protein
MKMSILALPIILLFVFTSCKKDDNSSSITTTSVIDNMQQGSWRITLYNDSGIDETYHFTGYSFTFSNGTVVATKSGNTASGIYSSGNDDNQVKFILDFGAISPFDELNDDWHVIEQSSSIIKMQDISGGDGGTDLLTFESN